MRVKGPFEAEKVMSGKNLFCVVNFKLNVLLNGVSCNMLHSSVNVMNY